MTGPTFPSQPNTSAGNSGGGGSSEFAYWAFISYSHSDEKSAAWLHRTLETYRVPGNLVGKAHRDGPLPRRLFPVFRDRDELASGHDLNEKIQRALEGSRYLVVLCSPRSARSLYVNEEIRRFKLMGRRERILAIIIEGEPKDVGGPADCFPQALRHPLRDDGSIDTTVALDPIAADARPDKDGPHNASLKVLAGMLEVGLDTLLQREKLRARRAMLRTALQAAAVLALAPLFVLGADAGLGLPGGESIRAWLDQEQMSVLRPPAESARVLADARKLRADLMAKFAEYRLPNDLYTNAEPASRKSSDGRIIDPTYWNTGQIISAIGRNPDLTPADAAIAMRGLRRLFTPDIIRTEPPAPGQPPVPMGWNEKDKIGNPTQGEVAAWICTALATCTDAMRRLEVLKGDPTSDAELAKDWATVTQVLGHHYHPQARGGWAMYPRQAEKDRYSHYTSTLMLMALLEARQAGLSWQGSTERRDELLRETAARLIAGYERDLDFPGWQSDDREMEARSLDGLTLQIYALLLSAENDGAIPPLPESMVADITAHLTRCAVRTLSYPLTSGEFSYVVEMDAGTGVRPMKFTEGINFHWYPWAIEACTQWQRRARRIPQPQLHITRVRRTLGHLVVDLGPEAIPMLGKGGNWTLAELLYCLGSVAPEKP